MATNTFSVYEIVPGGVRLINKKFTGTKDECWEYIRANYNQWAQRHFTVYPTTKGDRIMRRQTEELLRR